MAVRSPSPATPRTLFWDAKERRGWGTAYCHLPTAYSLAIHAETTADRRAVINPWTESVLAGALAPTKTPNWVGARLFSSPKKGIFMSSRSRILLTLAVVLFTTRLPAGAADVKPETEQQKVFYALGLAMARNLDQFNLTPDELTMVEAGLNDAVLKKTPQVDLSQYMQKVQALAKERQTALGEAEKKAAEEFLKKMAGEKGAVKTDSGIIMFEQKAGTGASPTATDMVKVNYHGTLRDGTVFDSSVERGTPASFRLNGVIPCWTEALQKMKVGGKTKVVCPSNLAYGERGFPPKIRPNSALVFEIELLEIVKQDATQAAPAPAKPAAPGAPKPEGH